MVPVFDVLTLGRGVFLSSGFYFLYNQESRLLRMRREGNGDLNRAEKKFESLDKG